MLRVRRPGLIFLCLTLFCGCQARLNDERKIEVPTGEIKAVLYEVQQREKAVRVAIRSPGVPVDAYLVLEKDRPALVQRLERQDQKPDNALAQGLGVQDTTLEGRIPAGSAFAVVLVTRGKDTTVTVKTNEGR
jgi:hypothetical protein